MPVTSDCTANVNAVELDLAGQRLRYRVDAAPGVTWVLNDEANRALLTDADHQHICQWPVGNDAPAGDDLSHAVGMQFGQGNGWLVWRVDTVSPDGRLLNILKHCRYEHAGAPDEHFAALRIFITGRA